MIDTGSQAIEGTQQRGRTTIVLGLVVSALLALTFLPPSPARAETLRPRRGARAEADHALRGSIDRGRRRPRHQASPPDRRVRRRGTGRSLSLLGPDGPIAGLYVDGPIQMAAIGDGGVRRPRTQPRVAEDDPAPAGPARHRRQRRDGRDDRTGSRRSRTSVIGSSLGSTSHPEGTARTPTGTGHISRA